jgi:hypothetical protein
MNLNPLSFISVVDSGQSLGYLSLLKTKTALGSEGIVDESQNFNFLSLVSFSGQNK